MEKNDQNFIENFDKTVDAEFTRRNKNAVSRHYTKSEFNLAIQLKKLEQLKYVLQYRLLKFLIVFWKLIPEKTRNKFKPKIKKIGGKFFNVLR